MNETELLGRANDLGFPMVVADGGPVVGERAWRAACAKSGLLASIGAQLDELEREHVRKADLDVQHGEQDQRRAAADTLDVEASAQEQRQAVDSLARYRAAAPDRLEALMHRQCALLEKLVQLAAK